jgi:transposase
MRSIVILNRCLVTRATIARPSAATLSNAVVKPHPSTATRKIQHAVDKALYAFRNRIERFFNRAKNSRRVATRYAELTLTSNW